MNYKILQENIGIKTLKDIILENREITKNEANFLLNPTSEYVENPFKLKNMSEGIQLFIEELDNESNIGLLVDSDNDGYCSSALMYLFLINECSYPKEKIQIFHHQKKTHGLSDDKVFKEIKKSDVNLMIIPDAGSNDTEQIKDLLKLGKKVLILDHHQINDDEQNTKFVDQEGNIIGVIINNQLDEYSTDLAGTGVVYKFLVALTENELEHYMDLVGIANIADSMYLNSFESRYIVDKGLKNINNELMKELIENAKLEGDLTPTDISFNVSNYINAVIRFGTMEEKENLFRALIGEEEEIEYTPRKSRNNPNPQTEIQTLQKAMVRISKSIKSKQDTAKKKSVEKCKQFISENGLDKYKTIVLIDEDNELIDRKITGLIAMNLVSIYKKSVVLLGRTKEKYTGSMRGFGVENFKEILESTEIVKVTGHNNSAGVEVEFKDIPRLIKRINRAMEEVEVIPPCTLVDCKMDLNNIKEKEMQEVLNLKPIWHQHCAEPLFLIEGLIIDSKKIRNPYTTLITFNINGIEIKKEYCSGVWKKEFLKEDVVKFGKPTLKCNLIVKIDYDNYKNKPCLSIVEAESEIIKDKKQGGIPF